MEKSYWSVKVRIKRKHYQPFEIEGLTFASDVVESAELAKAEVNKMLQNLPNFGGEYHLTMVQNKRLQVNFIAGNSEAEQAKQEIAEELQEPVANEPVANEPNLVEEAAEHIAKEPIVATEPVANEPEAIVATEPKPSEPEAIVATEPKPSEPEAIVATEPKPAKRPKKKLNVDDKRA